jgi:hypothetical protein
MSTIPHTWNATPITFKVSIPKCVVDATTEGPTLDVPSADRPDPVNVQGGHCELSLTFMTPLARIMGGLILMALDQKVGGR